MANTLTSLIPDLYESLDVVSRELTGFIPSVTRNSTADRVGINQTLRIPVAPASSASDFTPAMTLPTAAYQTIGNQSLTFTKVRYVPISWTGQEQKALNNNGPGYTAIRTDQIAQAIRTLVNEMEVDIATAAYQKASRGYGSAALTPFGTAGDFSDAAQVRKILDDNGAPLTDRSLVVSTAAGANIRAKQGVATVQADPSILRQGVLLDINGFMIRESAQVQSHTAGTASGAKVSGVVQAIGDTTLTLGATGTGTLVSGDIVAFANDASAGKYIVATGDADVSNGGTFTINAPGVRATMTSASAAITVTAAYTANVAFSRNAILFATRVPDMPMEGDLATDSTIITDPRTGLSLEVRYYPGVGMGTFYVMAAWGVSVIKPEHVAVLIG